jgi:hypothetical protein
MDVNLIPFLGHGLLESNLSISLSSGERTTSTRYIDVHVVSIAFPDIMAKEVGMILGA